MVELVVKGETIVTHRDILTKHSEYFQRCLKEPWSEAQKGSITFDDIEPRYLGLFVGVAFTFSSMLPVPTPQTSDHPEASSARTPLRDWIEVYKLCDRFVCPTMTDFLYSSIRASIGEGHRALFRSPNDSGLQAALIQDFADGYEALDLEQIIQKDLASTLIHYFCEGVGYASWCEVMDENSTGGKGLERPRFVLSVSRGFARKLEGSMSGRKLKRKELSGPGP